MGWAPGGFLGVDVFFVISGFLITALLLAEWRRDSFVDVWSFWRRRARRLLPAMLTLLVAVGIVVPFLAAEQAGRLRGDVWAALTYVSNWRLIFEHQSYFQAAGRPPLLQHLWSLAVEEQFYLVWPLMLWAGLDVRRRVSRLTAWIMAGAVGSAVLMGVLYTPGTDPSRVYYGTDTRVGAILLGAALACVWAPWQSTRQPTLLGRAVLSVAGVGALGALAWSVVHFHQFDDVLYRGGLFAVAAASAVLIAVLSHHGTPGANAVLGSRPMVWLGRRSYGLYLAHWPVIQLTRSYYDVPLSGAGLLALRAAITVGLAALSYRFVESPVRAGAVGRLWSDLQGRSTGRRGGRGWIALRSLGLASAVVAIGTTAVVARTSATPPALLALRAGALLTDHPAPLPVTITTSTTTTVTTTTLGPSISTTPPSTVAPTTVPTVTAPPAIGPPTVPSTVLPPGRVTGLGDSVLLETKATLERRLPDASIDAEVGRQFKELLAVARSLRDAGGMGEEVILQMGNNGPVTGSQFDDIMEVLKGARRVVVVNVKMARPWEPTNNAMLADGVGRWPTAVLVDWHKQGAAHPEFFADDGTHMGPTGVGMLAEMILSSL